MIANCICDSNILQNDDSNNDKSDEKVNFDKISFNSLTKTFISNLFDFNFNVLKCYNLNINPHILKGNIGFYFMLIMLFSQILFLIIHMMKGKD